VRSSEGGLSGGRVGDLQGGSLTSTESFRDDIKLVLNKKIRRLIRAHCMASITLDLLSPSCCLVSPSLIDRSNLLVEDFDGVLAQLRLLAPVIDIPK